MPKTALGVICALFLCMAESLAANPIKVIVFPLNGSINNATLSWLSEGIAVSISDQMGSRGVKVMSRNERIELIEKNDLPPGARLSRGSMIRVSQRASADLAVMGKIAGTEQDLRISVRVFDLKTLKLSGEMSANGPLSVLPQMENELAWLILANTGLEKTSSREKFYERMRKIPNSAYACYVQGLIASSENDQLFLLQKAVEIYRDFPEAHFKLGRIYFYRGNCAKAIPHLAQGQLGTGSLIESEFMRGTCCLSADDPIQAIQAFSHVLQISRPFEVLNNLGVAYLRKGDNTLALSTLIEAKELARTDSTVSLNLAIVRHLLGNEAAAGNSLEDAIKAHPKNGMLQFLLGFLLRIQGESDKAAAALDRARSLGINVDKIQLEDPRTWVRTFSSLDLSKTSTS